MNFKINRIEDNMVYFVFDDNEAGQYDVILTDVDTGLLLHQEKNWSLQPNIIYYIGLPIQIMEYIDLCDIKIEKNGISESIRFNFSDKKKEKIKLKLFNPETTSFYTYYEVFLENMYRSDITKIEENDVVLDIGANVGIFSLYAEKNKAGQIYSIEPDITNYGKLVQNTLQYSNIKSLNFGISDFCGLTTIYNTIDGVTSTMENFKELFPYCNYVDSNKVNTIDINILIDLLPHDKINLMKLDCEGCEEFIFDSITKKSLDKIEKIILEFHSKSIGNKIKDFLSLNQFEIEKIFNLNGNENIGMLYAYKF